MGAGWDDQPARVRAMLDVADYQSLYVGLHPVEDDKWGPGKSGFKSIVYMSSGEPCVCSSVGGVTEFIRDGENGYFATTASEWEDVLVRLVSDTALRARVATVACRTVEEGYSLQVHASRLAGVVRRVAR